MRQHWILIAVTIALLIGFRVITSMDAQLSNFSPLPALFLCSLVFFRGTKAWLLPLGAWVLSDPLVSMIQGYDILGWHHLSIALGLSVAVGLGFLLRRRPTTLAVLGGSLGAALGFYFLGNMVSFLGDPLYPKTLTGFVQAQWTGPAAPGFLPTWVFLRNLAAANFVFTGLFLAAHHAWAPKLAKADEQPAVATR